MTKTAQEVLKEVRADIRTVICDAVEKIKTETGLNPSELTIYVEMISEGPQYYGEPQTFVGEVDVNFKV